MFEPVADNSVIIAVVWALFLVPTEVAVSRLGDVFLASIAHFLAFAGSRLYVLWQGT